MPKRVYPEPFDTAPESMPSEGKLPALLAFLAFAGIVIYIILTK